MNCIHRFVVASLAAAALLAPRPSAADPVVVRNAEGLVHGFLALRTPEGKTLATGDLLQRAEGARVTTRLVYHFRDGSLHDETAVYTQRGHFKLVRYHLVQKGPAFEKPLEMTIDPATGKVDVVYKNDDGEEKHESEQMELPPDLANGMIITLLKNVGSAASAKVSFVAATPKPRLVKLEISSAGTEPFAVAGATHRATHFVVKVEIGGLAGVVAPLVGKQPPDSHVWVLGGEAPAFVRSRASLFLGGPLWQTELASPAWPAGK
jgi:hypothetical protein